MATGVVIAIYGVRADRRTKLGTLRLTEDGTVRLGPGFDSWAARFTGAFRSICAGGR